MHQHVFDGWAPSWPAACCGAYSVPRPLKWIIGLLQKKRRKGDKEGIRGGEGTNSLHCEIWHTLLTHAVTYRPLEAPRHLKRLMFR